MRDERLSRGIYSDLGDVKLSPYQRNLPRNAPTPPPLEFSLLWDVPAPFCPGELAAQLPGQVELGDGPTRTRIRLTDGQEVALEPTSEPPLAAESDRELALHPEFNGRTDSVRWEGLALFALPQRATLVAFDLENDRIAWEFHAAAATRVAPQVDRGRVELASLDNHLYCLRASNGHQLWRVRTAARLGLAAALWRDRVIVAPEGAPELESFHLRDGSRAGKFELGDATARAISAPAVIEDVLLVAYARYGSSACRLRAARLREAVPG